MPKAKLVDVQNIPQDYLNAISDNLRNGQQMDNVHFFGVDDVVFAMLIHTDDDGNLLGMEPLGCPACVSGVFRDGGVIRVAGEDAIPLSAISEDTAKDVAKDRMFLCPECGRPIVEEKDANE